jgi:small subunit ribosomal protein S3
VNLAVERKLIKEHKKRVAVREFLHRETERAGFGGAEISRTPMGTRIHLVTERPGFVIGRRGETIKKLTKNLNERFGLDNPQIEVAESENPSLNPQIMAQKLAEALERGWHFRRAGHSTLRRIMESGAKGALVTIAGKLTGGRKRTEKFLDGHIKWCGDTALEHMDYGYATAKKKLGIIGCSVAIMRKDAILPDEVTIHGNATTPAPTPKAQMGAAPAMEATAAPAAPPAKLEGAITELEGIGPAKAKHLAAAGYENLADLDEASVDDIAAVEGIGQKLAIKIKDELKKLRSK